MFGKCVGHNWWIDFAWFCFFFQTKISSPFCFHFFFFCCCWLDILNILGKKGDQKYSMFFFVLVSLTTKLLDFFVLFCLFARENINIIWSHRKEMMMKCNYENVSFIHLSIIGIESVLKKSKRIYSNRTKIFE